MIALQPSSCSAKATLVYILPGLVRFVVHVHSISCENWSILPLILVHGASAVGINSSNFHGVKTGELLMSVARSRTRWKTDHIGAKQSWVWAGSGNINWADLEGCANDIILACQLEHLIRKLGRALFGEVYGIQILHEARVISPETKQNMNLSVEQSLVDSLCIDFWSRSFRFNIK